MNKLTIQRFKGKDYAALKAKKAQWINNQANLSRQAFFSNAYCQDELFISQAFYPHSIDVEDRTLSLKHQKQFLMPEDIDFLRALGSDDSRIIWTLKEALIKETSGFLHDLISGKMRLDYRKVEANHGLISYQSKDYHFFFRTYENKVMGIVSREKIGKIEIID